MSLARAKTRDNGRLICGCRLPAMNYPTRQCALTSVNRIQPRSRHVRRSDPRRRPGSLLTPRWEESGFELVWGFSCQVVVFGFVAGSLFGAGGPFFVPSPTIRFAERAEGQGTETLAQLGGLPLSVACVSQRLDA